MCHFEDVNGVKSDKAERQGGGVGEEDSVDPHYSAFFFMQRTFQSPPPQFFPLSFSLCSLSTVYWLHGEVLHNTAFKNACPMV